MEKITGIADLFRKIPAAFLVAVITVLLLILFLPENIAKILSVEEFRDKYRVFLGPALLLAVSFGVARIYGSFGEKRNTKRRVKALRETLHKLTAEEKGYLAQYILEGKNSVHVGGDDGVMMGLVGKNITYRASTVGDLLTGFAFNLQPWAREYLEASPQLLSGAAGVPMTPREKMRAGW